MPTVITTPPIRAMSNVLVSYNGQDITGACNSANLNSTINEIETTTLASTGKETTPGQSEWKIECSGPWSRQLDDIIGVDVVVPVKRTAFVAFGPTTPAGLRVTYTWTAANNVGAYISNYSIDPSNPSEAITWSGTLTLSGAPVRAGS